MNIRPARVEDLEGCIDLFEEFKAESLAEYGLDLDLKAIRDTVEQYVKTTIVAEDGGKIVGILAGSIIRVPMCSTPIFQEVAWFVTKSHRWCGTHILQTAEDLAQAAGCQHMMMGLMHNSKQEKLANLYQYLGFAPCQTHYIKKLTGEKHAPLSQPPL